ncbi:hypothetical protein DU508_22175 [Pedobacter chinensis]|uniref:Uncharacterized protein n=1 Tax=Pedobacter chinensis TaxID=2282421 RepID=A0A369PUV3_9SPHI|nr:hypothetical protein DU508_22175 [Pedobacter chinensis]
MFMAIKKRWKSSFWENFIELIVCFGIIELLSILIFFYDTFAGSVYFKYFATTLYIYTVSEYFGHFNFTAILNIFLLNAATIAYILNSNFQKITLYKTLCYTIISVAFFVITYLMFRDFLKSG